MGIIFGLVLIVGAAAMWKTFRPKARDSRLACGLCALAGLAALSAGPGNTVFWLMEGAIGLVVAGCALLECRREQVPRRRAAEKIRVRALRGYTLRKRAYHEHSTPGNVA